MASTDGVSTDIGLSDIDEMIGQGTSAGQVGSSGFSSKIMIDEVAPRKKINRTRCVSTKVKVTP